MPEKQRAPETETQAPAASIDTTTQEDGVGNQELVRQIEEGAAPGFDQWNLSDEEKSIISEARGGSDEDRESILARLRKEGASAATISAIETGQDGFWSGVGDVIKDGELHILTSTDEGELTHQIDFEDNNLKWKDGEGHTAEAGYDAKERHAGVSGGKEGVAIGRAGYDMDTQEVDAGVNFHTGDIETDISGAVPIDGSGGRGRVAVEGEDWSTVVEGSGTAEGGAGSVTVKKDDLEVSASGSAGEGGTGSGRVGVKHDDWNAEAGVTVGDDSVAADVGGGLTVGDHELTGKVGVTHYGEDADDSGTVVTVSGGDKVGDINASGAATATIRDDTRGGEASADVRLDKDTRIQASGGGQVTEKDGVTTHTGAASADVLVGPHHAEADYAHERTHGGDEEGHTAHTVSADYHHTSDIGEDGSLVVGGGITVASDEGPDRESTGEGRLDATYKKDDFEASGSLEGGRYSKEVMTAGFELDDLVGEDATHGYMGRLEGSVKDGDDEYDGHLALGQLGGSTLFGAGFDYKSPDLTIGGSGSIISDGDEIAGRGALSASIPLSDKVDLGLGVEAGGSSALDEYEWLARADATIDLPSDLELLLRASVAGDQDGSTFIPEARLLKEGVFSAGVTGFVPMGEDQSGGGAMVSATYEPWGISAYGAFGDPRGTQFDPALTSIPGMDANDVAGGGGPGWEVGIQADLIKLFSKD
ncbi:MAG: hypothetical protein HN348_19125 [Proteobacteria bacterium]|jgi:hypothetical protein|nr:hypothetical protein [Pseudomonadota bacterium]